MINESIKACAKAAIVWLDSIAESYNMRRDELLERFIDTLRDEEQIREQQ